MYFLKLVSELAFIDASLRASIRTSTPIDVRAHLLREATRLAERIDRHAPHGRAELREMIAYFTRRAARATNDAARQSDTARAVALLEVRRSGVDTAAQGTRPGPESAVTGAALWDYVIGARDQVAAISSDYRYLAVSAPHAAHHATPQAGLIGAHVADMVGGERFARHDRARLDACLAGRIQEFHVAVERPDGSETVFRYQMKPVEDTGVASCCLVYLSEITETRRPAA